MIKALKIFNSTFKKKTLKGVGIEEVTSIVNAVLNSGLRLYEKNTNDLPTIKAVMLSISKAIKMLKNGQITKIAQLDKMLSILIDQFFKGCYDDNYDTLRVTFCEVACYLLHVLSPADFFKLFGSNKLNASSYMGIWKGILILLNNDNPTIREFIASSISEILYKPKNVKISIANSTGTTEYPISFTEFSDNYINHTLFKALFSSLEKEELTKEAMLNWLMEIFQSEYFLEQEAKNFEEKIFLYEPPNNFYSNIEVEAQIMKLIIHKKIAVTGKLKYNMEVYSINRH